jgi:hypothetical protein
MRVRAPVERARRSSDPGGAGGATESARGSDLRGVGRTRADAAGCERGSAQAAPRMSAPSDTAKTRSDGDETHWWIAYAAHSAVDGSARRDRAPTQPTP